MNAPGDYPFRHALRCDDNPDAKPVTFLVENDSGLLLDDFVELHSAICRHDTVLFAARTEAGLERAKAQVAELFMAMATERYEAKSQAIH